ncbi:FHA domain-containing protein [Streptomyces sp. QTS52]
MDRLTCTACDTEVGADEVVCPECRAVLTTDGAVLAGAAEPVPAPSQAAVTVTVPADRTACPHCGVSVDAADLVCMGCLRELRPSDRTGAPLPDAALRTTLERPVAAVQLRFKSGGVVEVRAGQEVTLGRAAQHTASAPQLAGFDNISRTHATVGVTSDGAVWLRDEGSANGTWADEVPVPRGRTRPLHDGSVIRLASNVTAEVLLRNGTTRG